MDLAGDGRLYRNGSETMINNPELLPISKGKGTVNAPCAMTKAALVHAHRFGYLDADRLGEVFTDRPCWVSPVISNAVIYCNDVIPTGSRLFDRLDAMVPRIVDATICGDRETELRVTARVLCWAAREVLWLVRDEDRAVCLAAIETRERWLRGVATEHDCVEAARAAAAARAARAAAAARAAGAARAAAAARADGAVAAAVAARADGAVAAAVAAGAAARAAGAVQAAEAAVAAGAAGAALDILDGMLDAHAKAKAEEGAATDDGWHQALINTGLMTEMSGANIGRAASPAVQGREDVKDHNDL